MITPQELESLPESEKRRRLVELASEAMMLAASLTNAPEAGQGARWICTAEALTYLGISRPTLGRYKKRGLLHPVPMGRSDRYSTRELDLLPETIGMRGPWK